MKNLDHDIIVTLAKKLNKKQSTVKKDIYLLRKSYPTSTLNAVAQIYAQTYKQTVYRKLDRDDKNSLPNIQLEKEKITIKQRAQASKSLKKKLIELIKYSTNDYFRKGHLEEINKAYTYTCYTSVFIMLRKIVENMLIDILRFKFPPNTQENKELYFDINQNRFKDFSIIIANLKKKSPDFGIEKKLVERIADLSKSFKDKTNDKTHSWFHLVKNKAEIDELDPQMLIELISRLENNMGMK